MLEDAYADLVQVFEEAVENGHQVGRRQLVAEDHRQLVDGERQRAAHFPLEERKRVMTVTVKEGKCYTTDTQVASEGGAAGNQRVGVAIGSAGQMSQQPFARMKPLPQL